MWCTVWRRPNYEAEIDYDGEVTRQIKYSTNGDGTKSVSRQLCTNEQNNVQLNVRNSY